MTNWPNIQDYRNLEAKFFNVTNCNDAGPDSQLETDNKTKIESEDLMNCQRSIESKTVRCVIRKDFEETFKKFDRGDGLAVNQECLRSKISEPMTAVDQSAYDKIRLQNHLKWKKQKEEEFFQKKEAERLAQEKKKEEEIKLKKILKQKEIERENKLREWKEQKEREKESRKREKMVMKVLQEELKEATPVMDKERLIEEWVKLKDKQKQIEAEKKAEIQKREEESRALRQNLAALSYRQWKERAKGRMMLLPKNGYQIFAPKPVPVVKEDWNHNFTSDSPRHQFLGLRNSQSTTTSLSFRSDVKDQRNPSKDIFYLDLKNRSPNNYNLKKSRSGLSMSNEEGISKTPLKDLQTEVARTIKSSKSGIFEENDNFMRGIPREINSGMVGNIYKNKNFDHLNREKSNFSNEISYIYPPNGSEDRSHYSNLTLQGIGKQLEGGIPNKKKIDLYINPPHASEAEESFRIKTHKKIETKNNESVKDVLKKEKKETVKENRISKPKMLNQINFNSNVSKVPSEAKLKPKTANKLDKSIKDNVKKNIQSQVSIVQSKGKISRRSRSCDKTVKKFTKDHQTVKGCLSSNSLRGKSMEESSNAEKTEKKKVGVCQRRKNKKQTKPNSADTPLKKEGFGIENESKPRKKVRKNVNHLSKSLSFIDSPYYSKKASLKTSDKSKDCRRKATKDESKCDGAGRSRKPPTTNI